MTGKMRIHTVVLLRPLLFFSFWAALWAAREEVFWGLLLAVAVHESGHWLAAGLIGEKLAFFSLFRGGGMEARRFLPPRREAAAAAGGPLANLLAWSFFYILGRGEGSLAQGQLLLAFFNLLPFLPLDGGRICRAILLPFFDYYRLSRALAALGQAAALLWVLLIIIYGAGWLSYAAPVFLFLLSGREKKQAIYAYIRYLLHRPPHR
ncbi:MAG: hypothetical protein FWD39_05050 [Clostridiales bacterium]|nr:hypothetical protein [Clostridiales bacterium]